MEFRRVLFRSPCYGSRNAKLVSMNCHFTCIRDVNGLCKRYDGSSVRRDFRDKLCVYCGSARAETDDHIFSAKLFLEKDRGHLPEAPACRACNGKKSIWEHYLASVLPFGDAMDRKS